MFIFLYPQPSASFLTVHWFLIVTEAVLVINILFLSAYSELWYKEHNKINLFYYITCVMKWCVTPECSINWSLHITAWIWNGILQQHAVDKCEIYVVKLIVELCLMPQKLVTLLPCPGGRTMKSTRTCGGIGPHAPLHP
jgi:hypothetical protein